MPQQSTTRPREAEKTVGPKTREQQKAIIEKRENTKAADVSPRQKTLDEARRDSKPAAGEYDLSSGDRSIKHGTRQTGHHKNRADE